MAFTHPSRMVQLNLGWCQGYQALKYHYDDAYAEINQAPPDSSVRPEVAIFAKSYYEKLKALNTEKKHDFVFIGSIKSDQNERQWVIDFAKEHFTKDSVFINTDKGDWNPIGIFDRTFLEDSYCHMNYDISDTRQKYYRTVEDNLYYFKTMATANFVLCPAGDAPWSFRFYETLLCQSIPVVASWHDTYRTATESSIRYKYRLYSEVGSYDEDEVEYNDMLFRKNHLL